MRSLPIESALNHHADVESNGDEFDPVELVFGPGFLKQFRAGDPAARSRLAKFLFPLIRRQAAHYFARHPSLYRDSDADDIALEVLMGLLEHPSRLKFSSMRELLDLKRELTQQAVRQHVEAFIARHESAAGTGDQLIAPPGDDPAVISMEEDLRRHVHDRAIDRVRSELGEEAARIFEQRYQGASPAQIAEGLHQEPRQVQATLRRIHTMLRHDLAEFLD